MNKALIINLGLVARMINIDRALDLAFIFSYFPSFYLIECRSHRAPYD